jgi:hypothetical protein
MSTVTLSSQLHSLVQTYFGISSKTKYQRNCEWLHKHLRNLKSSLLQVIKQNELDMTIYFLQEFRELVPPSFRISLDKALYEIFGRFVLGSDYRPYINMRLSFEESLYLQRIIYYIVYDLEHNMRGIHQTSEELLESNPCFVSYDKEAQQSLQSIYYLLETCIL